MVSEDLEPSLPSGISRPRRLSRHQGVYIDCLSKMLVSTRELSDTDRISTVTPETGTT